MSNEKIDLTRYKKAWTTASQFPTNKEEVYPEHGVVQEFDIHHDKEVLEYGCGAGSDALSYFRRGNYVTCVDITPENLYTARCNIEKAGFLRDAEFKLLEYSYPVPFPDNYFDLVNSHGVIHHIPAGSKVVDEFFRVLKPGGLVYIMLYTDHLWDHFEEQIKKFQEEHQIDKFEAFCWCTDSPGTPYARAYSEEEGCMLLKQAGFTSLKPAMWKNKYFCTYKAVKPE